MITYERKVMIDDYIAQLRKSFGAVRKPIDEKELTQLNASKDYAAMVRFIRASMQIQAKLTLGFVNGGGKATSMAWVKNHPPRWIFKIFGAKSKFTIFIRKSFLALAHFEKIVKLLSHEMSHVLLDLVDHPLRNCEEAVDLTAMFFGYQDFYIRGWSIEVFEYPIVGHVWRERSIGYLTREEVRYAAHVMTFGNPPR